MIDLLSFLECGEVAGRGAAAHRPEGRAVRHAATGRRSCVRGAGGRRLGDDNVVFYCTDKL
jgi:hypothetical protein